MHEVYTIFRSRFGCKLTHPMLLRALFGGALWDSLQQTQALHTSVLVQFGLIHTRSAAVRLYVRCQGRVQYTTPLHHRHQNVVPVNSEPVGRELSLTKGENARIRISSATRVSMCSRNNVEG